MEASLPSLSWRGKGSIGLTSRFLGWDRRCFTGLSCWNSASMPALTHSAHDWLSPTLPVSMGAGVLEQAAGVSVTGSSSAGVSWTGAMIAPVLGSLEPVVGVSALFCESWWDSLGVTWGHLGSGTPVKWGHLWRWCKKFFLLFTQFAFYLVCWFSHSFVSEACACFGECL